MADTNDPTPPAAPAVVFVPTVNGLPLTVHTTEAGAVGDLPAFPRPGMRCDVVRYTRVPTRATLDARIAAVEDAGDALPDLIYQHRRLDKYPKHKAEADRLEAAHATLRELLSDLRALRDAVGGA
jgi:hypothetical protein